MPLSLLYGDHGREFLKSGATGPGPGGASRLIVATDEEGNQALRLVPEDRAIYLTIMPLCGDESERRAVKAEFAGIGRGLTSVSALAGEGEWHPGHRPPLREPVEVLSGIGPHTPGAREEFLRCLTFLGERLGQDLVVGVILPLGEVFEVWSRCLVQVRPGGPGVAQSQPHS